MVAMAELHTNAHSGQDKEGQAVDAIEELIAEFGLRATIKACLRSRAGGQFGRMGGNATLAVIQEILRVIVFSEDPQLEAEIMALGAGVLLEDKQTVTRVGAKHGLTKQAVSKRVIAFCEKWKLPPSEFMRSERDRLTYAATNKPRIT